MAKTTLYWHDYETFGVDPSRDRPSQFAGIRTDEDLNIIGDPLVIYCKPAKDMLPDPIACLITGILPQKADEEGYCEAEFITKIHRQLVQPGTCGVGYNTIRFDDEVTRYTLYRNFFDPYEREWKNGNSRWDIIDMVRLTHALRPEGIEWPRHEDGKPSFRLEQLTKANGIAHESAHDALSDVHATIAVAKLIKTKQPRLYDYIYQLRFKKEIQSLLDVVNRKPVLHVSSMFSVERGCMAIVMPLVKHPTNSNGIVTFDLSEDPTPLIELSVEEIKARLFTPTAELPVGVSRIPLKTIHVNRCPVVATVKLLDAETAEKWGIDIEQCYKHYQQLDKILSDQSGLIIDKLQKVFSDTDYLPITDPDRMLYSGGFFSAADKRMMQTIRQSSPEKLATLKLNFEDQRLDEMLFRYRGRNFPATLNEDEKHRWEEFRYRRLTEEDGGASLTLDQLHERLESLMQDESYSVEQKRILQSLAEYSDQLLY